MTRRTLPPRIVFEYTCDGYRQDGKRCKESATVGATSADLADQTAKGRGWVYAAHGWICPTFPHREPFLSTFTRGISRIYNERFT